MCMECGGHGAGEKQDEARRAPSQGDPCRPYKGLHLCHRNTFSRRSCESNGVKNRYLTHPASHKKNLAVSPLDCKVTNGLFLQEAS